MARALTPGKRRQSEPRDQRITAAFPRGVVRGAYPERQNPRISKLDEIGDRLVGPFLRNWRAHRRNWAAIVALVEAHTAETSALRDQELIDQSKDLRRELALHGLDDALVGRVFALVREASGRVLGTRHYDVQLMGGYVLLRGMVAEMQTGEGKTLTATLPACCLAFAGVPVHIVTVNDYLAERDAENMGPLYRALGISVGVVKSGMDPPARRAAYACEVTYCTNNEVAFDYLKDRIALKGNSSRRQLRMEKLVHGEGRVDRLIHRGLHFAIVDEADSILVDEARTPLIISSGKMDPNKDDFYRTALELAGSLQEGPDFAIDASERQCILSKTGQKRLEELAEELTGLWRGRRRRNELVRQALCALHLFNKDQHYLVNLEKVQIIDEYTGRVMPDRSWEHGLHQMIEAKEGVPLTGQQDTLARISYQRFFSKYLQLSGMTGTAHEVSGELWNSYRLPVATIPTNRPCRREAIDERVFMTRDEKWEAVVERVEQIVETGRPVLIGTRSVEASEQLSKLLQARGVVHRVLNARQDREEAEIVSQAGEPGRITVATNMAGRGTDIKLAQGVDELGGLYVLGTERHDAGRIDRQLAGRCARQGDPGSVEFIVSLEDELCTAHAGPLAKRLATRAGRSDSRIAHWLRSQVQSNAQRRVGRLHARMRRDLRKSDSQLETMLAFSGRGD